jgi:hypothetical protein
LYFTRAGKVIVGGWKFHIHMKIAPTLLVVLTGIMKRFALMICPIVGGELTSD